MYNVDFNRQAKLSLPEEKRKPIILDFIYSALKGVKDIHVKFLNLRRDTSYYLDFNGQTIYLEHVLNEQFDPNGLGIYIDNVVDDVIIFFYNKSEAKLPEYFYNKSELKPPAYYSNKIEYVSYFDFIVYVPLALVFDQNKMKALINKYRYAGKRYQIQTY